MTTLDWNKVNQKAQELSDRLNRSGGGPGAKFLKLSDGQNVLRILPGWAKEGPFQGQFWREVAQHWRVSEDQKGPVLCPKKTPHLEGDCPICDFVEQLKAAKGDARAQELAKEMRAKVTYLLSAVDINDPMYTASDVAEYKKARPDSDVPFDVGDTKVQVYAAPSTVFNQILNAIQVNQVDVTDPENGHNIIITKTGKGFKTRYQTTVAINPGPAPEGAEPLDLSSIGFEMDWNEMMGLIAEGPGGDYAGLLSAGSSSSATVETADDAVDSDALRARMQEALNNQ